MSLNVPVPAPPEDAALADLDFAVVDLETTGWSPQDASITEIGAVRVRGGVRSGEFASLVNPGTPVPSSIEELTGITDWLVGTAPGLAAILPGLLRFADGCVLVAHNAPFDVGFLAAACAACGLAWPRFTVLDTVLMARQVMEPDEVPDCKLGTLARFFGARTVPAHRALADARATADVLYRLIERFGRRGVKTLGQLNALLEAAAAEEAAAAAARAEEAAAQAASAEQAGTHAAHAEQAEQAGAHAASAEQAGAHAASAEQAGSNAASAEASPTDGPADKTLPANGYSVVVVA